MVKFTAGALARSSELLVAGEIFRHFVMIVMSKNHNAAVQEAIEGMAKKFGFEESAVVEEEETNADNQISLPKEDCVSTKKLTTFKDSPFCKYFKTINDDVEDVIKEAAEELPELKQKANAYYIPKIVKHLLRYMLPFYPLWSRYNQCQILPNQDNPLTNFSAELHILQAKETQKHKSIKASKYVREMTIDTEKRILAYDHEIDFKRCRYSRKRKAPSVVDDDVNEDEVRIVRKKPAKEVWGRINKNFRPPGGHYSKTAAQTYALKLIKRARRVGVPSEEKLQSSTDDPNARKDPTEDEVVDNVITSVSTPLNDSLVVSSLPTRPFRLNSPEGTIPIISVAEESLVHSESEIEDPIKTESADLTGDDYADQFLYPAVPSRSEIDLMDGNKDNSVDFDVLGTSPASTPLVDIPLNSFSSLLERGDALSDVPTSFAFTRSEVMVNSDVPLEIFSHEDENNLPECGSVDEIGGSVDVIGISDGMGTSPVEKLPTPVPMVISSRIPFEFPAVPETYKGDIFGQTLYKSDFEFLLQGEELSDPTIDAFMRLMKMKAAENVVVHAIPAHLLTSVSLGLDVKGDFKSKICFIDLWLVPTQINRNHWILFAVFIKRKVVLVLDPLDKSGIVKGEKENCLKVLFYLLNLSHTTSLRKQLKVSDWAVHAPKDVSIQRNSVDCGLIVCLWANALCNEGGTLVPKVMTEQHSVKLRKWLSHVLFTFGKRKKISTIKKGQPEAISKSFGRTLIVASGVLKTKLTLLGRSRKYLLSLPALLVQGPQ